MRFLNLKTIFVLLVALILASGSSVNAQALMKAQESAYENELETERQRRDKQKTRKAQAVSKKVYERIIKAQEAVDLEDYPEALRVLNNLYSMYSHLSILYLL